MKSILEVVSRKRVETSSALQALMDAFKKHYPSEVSLADFCKWTALNPSIITPVLMLQLQLRRQIIGEKYWMQQTDDRSSHPEKCRLLYVKVLQDKIVANTEQFNNVKRQNSIVHSSSSKKKFGAANEEDIVNNNNRKQSLLMTAFNMRTPSSKNNNSSSRIAATATDSEPPLGGSGSSKSGGVVVIEGGSSSRKVKSKPMAAAATNAGEARKRRSSLFNKPKLTK